jgi:hypothetical protein
MLLAASTVTAETLLMPPRDFLAGANEVVWGVTTQANGTAFVLDYGDGSAQQTGNVADRSYIAFNHTYALANTYTVQLCVGVGAAIPGCPGELATVQVQVFNGAALSDENLRNLNINRAIQSGLRYLWVNQFNRATNFPASPMTSWITFVSAPSGSADRAVTGLAVLAFLNHGYALTGNTPATGIYEKYIVERGLNYIASRASQLSLTVQTTGDPCVGPGIEPAPCIGLYDTFDPGYSTANSAVAFAASNSLNRILPAGLGGPSGAYVAGKTYGEVLQRYMNAIAYGQNDNHASLGQGGWIYQFSNNQGQQSDGSTVGWDILALLDAAAAGTAIPAFVKTNFANFALPSGLNNDGSFDYRADGSPTSSSGNVAKAGIGIQGLFYTDVPVGDARVTNGTTYISTRWNATTSAPNQDFVCINNGGGAVNKGCGYAMFNVFKGLKLYGITTLPGVTRPAGPGAIPAGDWYADYVDWLVTNQTSPLTTTGGNWATLSFSCCFGGSAGGNTLIHSAIIAELILAPTALVPPDPELFSSVGLKQGTPLSINPDTNPVNTLHSVVAKAESQGGAAIPGVTICFDILAGSRNDAVAIACGITDGNGEVSRSYTDVGPSGSPGTDSIRAFIGPVGSNLASNTLVKNWIVPVTFTPCDADADQDVDDADLLIIRNANRQASSGPSDPRDGNADGRIDIADVRYCQLRKTVP